MIGPRGLSFGRAPHANLLIPNNDKPDARKMSFALNFDVGAFRSCSAYFAAAGSS